MNSSESTLAALRAELERLDYVVVPHRHHICVRLPLAASVRVAVEGDRVRFVPQFGPFRRTSGLLVTSGVSAAAVGGAAAAFGAEPATLVVAFLGVVALAHDACRFVLTEGCLTRIQQLLAGGGALRPAAPTLAPPSRIPEPPALGAPPPAVAETVARSHAAARVPGAEGRPR